jgi:hypothetical protein
MVTLSLLIWFRLAARLATGSHAITIEVKAGQPPSVLHDGSTNEPQPWACLKRFGGIADHAIEQILACSGGY